MRSFRPYSRVTRRGLAAGSGGNIGHMNGHRYHNYLFVLEVLESNVFTDVEREILADAAEGLLLARLPNGDDVDEIGIQVSAVLDELVSTDRLRYATAVELRARIAECGPAGAPLQPA